MVSRGSSHQHAALIMNTTVVSGCSLNHINMAYVPQTTDTNMVPLAAQTMDFNTAPNSIMDHRHQHGNWLKHGSWTSAWHLVSAQTWISTWPQVVVTDHDQ